MNSIFRFSKCNVCNRQLSEKENQFDNNSIILTSCGHTLCKFCTSNKNPISICSFCNKEAHVRLLSFSNATNVVELLSSSLSTLVEKQQSLELSLERMKNSLQQEKMNLKGGSEENQKNNENSSINQKKTNLVSKKKFGDLTSKNKMNTTKSIGIIDKYDLNSFQFSNKKIEKKRQKEKEIEDLKLLFDEHKTKKVQKIENYFNKQEFLNPKKSTNDYFDNLRAKLSQTEE